MNEIFTDGITRCISALDERSDTALRMVETRLICPNPYHPISRSTPQEFQSLVEAIADDDGINSPLTVRSIGTLQKPLFQLISEEKRLRACIYADVSLVPCVIIDANRETLPFLEAISLPRNFFEEIDFISELIDQKAVSKAEIAKYYGFSMDKLERRLCLREFDRTERKIVLRAEISAEHAIRLHHLDARTKCEVYRAMLNGVYGRSAEDLIYGLSESKVQTRIYIKNAGLFYNSVDKAVATMNRSGISVKCAREEKKTFTRLTITVPKRC